MELTQSLLIILFTPLGSAVLIALMLRRKGGLAATVSVLAALTVAVLSLYQLWHWDGTPVHVAHRWFEIGAFTMNMGFYFDYQAALLLFVVSFVGFWIHVFSIGYMDDDKAQARFFGGLSIFMFSMLGIVLADNLLMIFVFWELVGVSSYMLIAHYFDTRDAAEASKKAFIVNRVGDLGFIIGIVWAYWHYGTVQLLELQAVASANPDLIKAGIALLLMCGFIGKSAQFPLQVWLPDAMAGPTPISALIHAATMVAAGVYFLCRVDFLFPAMVKDVVMWLGAIMTAYAGFCALGQRDIKKILAYSTLSQLGYMATAYGLGYPGLALFHLTTHAFFKALLFLGSGSVIHACHHEQDIFKMGGLIRRMPITTGMFLLGLLALCGVTYFSGYYSKDAIIEAAYLDNRAVYGLIFFSAFLTALYMGRLFWVAFLGQPKSTHAEQARESGFFMVLPLLVLGFFAVTAGYTQFWPQELTQPFIEEYHHVHHEIDTIGLTMQFFWMAVAAWASGLILTLLFYGLGAKEDRLQQVALPVYALFRSKLWFDDVYLFYVKSVQQRVADILCFLDLFLISGIVVRGSAGIMGLLGIAVRAVHVGSIQAYVYWFLIGLVLFGAYAIGWFAVSNVFLIKSCQILFHIISIGRFIRRLLQLCS